MAERFDDYEPMPSGMGAYLSHYGRHISKPMYLWAVSMMEDRSGQKMRPAEKEDVMAVLKTNNVTVENNKAYDVPFVYMMGKSDYMGSSIADEMHLAKFVKDYLDDKDGSETRAFDELYVKTLALGIPIDWMDVI